MRHIIAILLITLPMQAFACIKGSGHTTDTQKLGMALDYFAAGKYHEALMMFLKLDKKYKLNPRFKAYMGICHYHEWNYEQACSHLDEAIPHLDIYAPAERNIYYNAAAESHFELKEYDKAIPYYEMQLLVCRPDEKGGVLYRLGFCYMFKEKWEVAAEYYRSAIECYTRYPLPDASTRIIQMENMIKGCGNR